METSNQRISCVQIISAALLLLGSQFWQLFLKTSLQPSASLIAGFMSLTIGITVLLVNHDAVARILFTAACGIRAMLALYSIYQMLYVFSDGFPTSLSVLNSMLTDVLLFGLFISAAVFTLFRRGRICGIVLSGAAAASHILQLYRYLPRNSSLLHDMTDYFSPFFQILANSLLLTLFIIGMLLWFCIPQKNEGCKAANIQAITENSSGVSVASAPPLLCAGKRLLQVTGVLYMILSEFAFLFSLRLLPLFDPFIQALGISCLLFALLALFAGIFAVLNCNNPKCATACFIIGLCYFILSAAGVVISIVDPSITSASGIFLANLILPALYALGGYKNRER